MERAFWQIALFGPLRAQNVAHRLSRFRTQKTASLLAFLAYHVGQSFARERLCELFWPEQTPAEARNSLRVAAASLRRQLEPPPVPAGSVLVADRAGLSLSAEACATDVARFRSHLSAAGKADTDDARLLLFLTALEAYTGDLLPDCYDDWAGAEREHLAETYQDAAHRAASLLSAQGELPQAADVCLRALAFDPLREKTHRLLMRLHARQGRKGDALAQFRRLQQSLQTELGSPPSAKTTALAAELFGDKAASGSDKPRVTRRKAETVPVPMETKPAHPAPVVPTDAPLLGNLPKTWTLFFGRDGELETIADAVQNGARLITLTGPGGTGKTRLLLEAARHLHPEFAGGAWWVDAGDVNDAARLPDVIITALGLTRAPNAEPLAALSDALRAWPPFLLLLDGMETIAAPAAPMVQTLLGRVPSLTCLASSRRRLSLPAERELPVLPLPVPDAENGNAPAALAQNPAVQLFVDRARLARPDFGLTPRNADAVAALCRTVEGIPLALELVAARAGSFSPAQMRAQLTTALDAPASLPGARRPQRQSSLRAAMAWSVALLPVSLKTFFASLSVFRGGWTLDAAKDVCAEPDAAECLAQLRAHSLVTIGDGASGELRFAFLDTVRAFAAELVTPAQENALHERRAQFYLRLVQDAAPHKTKTPHENDMARLRDEAANFAAVLDAAVLDAAALSPPDASLLELRLVDALSSFWYLSGLLSEGRTRAEAALSRPWAQDAAPERAAVLHAAGLCAYGQGDYAASESWYEQCLSLRRAAGDDGGVGRVLNSLANIAIYRCEYPRARALYEEALLLIRQGEGSPRDLAVALANLGNIAYAQGDFPAARARFWEARTAFAAVGDTASLSYAILNMGMTEFDDGNFAEARVLYDESLRLERQWDDTWGEAYSLAALGELERAEGRPEQAASLFTQSLSTVREMGDALGIATALLSLGRIHTAAHEFAAAQPCLAEALTLWRGMGNRLSVAATLESIGALWEAQKQGTRAAQLWGAADALRHSSGCPLAPTARRELEPVQEAARATLGADAFAHAWETGRALSWEQAVDLALQDAPLPANPAQK